MRMSLAVDPPTMTPRLPDLARLRGQYQRIGLLLTLLSPIIIPIGFWLAFLTPRPCNIDFCSGTVATAVGGTLLWTGIASLGVGTGLLRAAARPR